MTLDQEGSLRAFWLIITIEMIEVGQGIIRMTLEVFTLKMKFSVLIVAHQLQVFRDQIQSLEMDLMSCLS